MIYSASCVFCFFSFPKYLKKNEIYQCRREATCSDAASERFGERVESRGDARSSARRLDGSKSPGTGEVGTGKGGKELPSHSSFNLFCAGLVADSVVVVVDDVAVAIVVMVSCRCSCADVSCVLFFFFSHTCPF